MPSAGTSRATSPKHSTVKSTVPNAQSTDGSIDQQQLDLASLNLQDDLLDFEGEEPPKLKLTQEKVLEQARAALDGDSQGKKDVSLVVIGTRVHVNMVIYSYAPIRCLVQDMLMLENLLLWAVYCTN